MHGDTKKEQGEYEIQDSIWDYLVNLHAQRSGKSASSRSAPAQSTMWLIDGISMSVRLVIRDRNQIAKPTKQP